MSKRRIIVDGEVKLVTHGEWLNHKQPNSAVETKPRKAKLSIDKIQVESDPVQPDESNNEDQD